MTKQRFAAVFEGGSSRRFPLVTLRWREGSGAVGFAISKKAGTKPRRNRIKRRLVAAWSDLGRNVPDLAARIEGLDVIVSAGTRILDVPFVEIQTALEDALRGILPEAEGGEGQ